MAKSNSQLDKLSEVPPWQLGLAWVMGAALLGAGWYFLYYVDAQTQNKAAGDALTAAKAAITTAEASLANYEARVKEQAEKDKKLPEMLEKAPMDAATLDHLMGNLEREARGVGLEFERWIPLPEERENDFAKMKVEVTAIGTWHEMGELFRRANEFTQALEIGELSLKLERTFDTSGFPQLQIDFTVTVYRLLSEEEQKAVPEDEGSRRKGKRK